VAATVKPPIVSKNSKWEGEDEDEDELAVKFPLSLSSPLHTNVTLIAFSQTGKNHPRKKKTNQPQLPSLLLKRKAH